MMDFRAVVVLILCALVAQADCRPVANATNSTFLNATAQDLWKCLQNATTHLEELGLDPNIKSPRLNTIELGESDQQPLTMQQLSAFSCYILNISEPRNELTGHLKKMAQYISSMTDAPVPRDCAGHTFDKHMERYQYIKRLLQLLQQRLSKAPFFAAS